MSDYSVSVKNESGSDVQVAIYQDYPNIKGLPLIWLLQNINDGNKNTYSWGIDWALNWGTSNLPLAPGVLWNSGGLMQKMNPTASGGKNSMGVTYVNKQFKTAPEAYHDPEVLLGSMGVQTDKTFTTKDSAAMSLAVYMNSKPAFAMQGRPNGNYMFDTHPTYWICTTDSKQGVAVSGKYVSQPKQIVFENGITALNFTLTDTLEFIEG